jgi:hypothetical protein
VCLGHRDDQPGKSRFFWRYRILTSITPYARPFKKVKAMIVPFSFCWFGLFMGIL